MVTKKNEKVIWLLIRPTKLIGYTKNFDEAKYTSSLNKDDKLLQKYKLNLISNQL